MNQLPTQEFAIIGIPPNMVESIPLVRNLAPSELLISHTMLALQGCKELKTKLTLDITQRPYFSINI